MQRESGREIKVAIAGGGISGLTAALRLAQRGYKVTLYEPKSWLGGNLGSHLSPGNLGLNPGVEGAWHDVYSHMYPEFYVNFWDIVENDLGMRRDHSDLSDFEPHYSLQFVGGDGRFKSLRDAWDPRSLWDNLTTGIHQASPLDMFLFFYSFLDLVCHEFGEIGPLSESVNAFIRSRPWATKQVAALHDFLIMLVWAIHATGTEAASYQKFIHSGLGNATPLLWLLKGTLEQTLIGPLEQKLEALECHIKKNTAVTKVELLGDRVCKIRTAPAGYDYENQNLTWTDDAFTEVSDFDYLILAVPPKSLGKLAVSGPPGGRIHRLRR